MSVCHPQLSPMTSRPPNLSRQPAKGVSGLSAVVTLTLHTGFWTGRRWNRFVPLNMSRRALTRETLWGQRVMSTCWVKIKQHFYLHCRITKVHNMHIDIWVLFIFFNLNIIHTNLFSWGRREKGIVCNHINNVRFSPQVVKKLHCSCRLEVFAILPMFSASQHFVWISPWV